MIRLPRSGLPKLEVRFFRASMSGSEPVREWLQALPKHEKKAIGENIKAAQFGWPLGLPLIEHIAGDIWEVRTKLENRIARVLFAFEGNTMVLLHGFIKKDRRTRRSDLELARDRLKRLRGDE